MRVTGGEFCGRVLKSPGGDTRPTQDMVREALFSMLAVRVAGSRFLDLFAGSGSVGLDAASRGAASVWWVESDARTAGCLRNNVESIIGDAAASGMFSAIRMDVFAFLKHPQAVEPFDMVFADPPYEFPAGRRCEADWSGCLAERLLKAVSSDRVLSRQGLFIIEQHADQPACIDPTWRVLRERTYGKTKLVIYSRNQGG